MRSRQSIVSFLVLAQELFSQLLRQFVMIGFHGEMTFDSFQLPVSKGCQGAVFVCVCRVSAGSAIF
jgi:hypothetical protein